MATVQLYNSWLHLHPTSHRRCNFPDSDTYKRFQLILCNFAPSSPDLPSVICIRYPARWCILCWIYNSRVTDTGRTRVTRRGVFIVQHPPLYEIWDFHDGEDLGCGLLGYDFVNSGRLLGVFRKNIHSIFSAMNLESLCFLEILVTIHYTIQFYDPNLRLLSRLCGNFGLISKKNWIKIFQGTRSFFKKRKVVHQVEIVPAAHGFRSFISNFVTRDRHWTSSWVR